MTGVFETWSKEQTEAWGTRPGVIGHRLHLSSLFSLEGLAELIEGCPKEHYSLIHMGAQGGRRFWREGILGDVTGAEAIDAIRNGRMWLNLRNIMTIDPRYREVVEVIFAEIAANVEGFASFDERVGVLISSPNAQVYYHTDLPGQALWQIHGTKRLYVYPPNAPFLLPEHLENIALNGVEVDMPYERAYDAHAMVVDLQPGQMAHWPLNAPHRIENHDCLNVSMTMEFWTEDIRRLHMLNVANGLLRQHVGLRPRSRATTGSSFWTKAVLQAAVRRSGWLSRKRATRRPIEFRLDRGAVISGV